MVRCMPRRSFSEAGSDGLRPPSARKTVTAVDLSRRSFSTRRSLRARRPRFWEATCLQRLASTCYKGLLASLRLVSISICATSLVACTELSPLRQNSDANPHNSVVAGAGYKLAFLEFGEQGSYQDTSQLKNAIQLVQNTNKPLVITYVHGWQNNAVSGDVQRFSGLLSRLNRAPAVRDAGFNVVGVYIGWRGKLSPVPVLKELSFWNRQGHC